MGIAEQLRRFAQGQSRVADLSETLAFTFRLLEDPWAWRQRSVHTLVLEGADHIRSTESFQVEFPPVLLREFGITHADVANVIIPLTTRVKRPLLRFDVSAVSGSSPHLLSRRSIAAIQATYVRNLVETSTSRNATAAGLGENLLEAIFVFTPGLYRSFLTQGPRHRAIQSYLRSGLGVEVNETVIADWLASTDHVSGVLASEIEEMPDPTSSSECVLLALPHLDPLPSGIAEAGAIVQAYCDAVMAASAAGDRDLLAAIARYGRRWELLLEVELPIGRPTEVTVAEDLPYRLDAQGWLRAQVPFRDARSAHIQVGLNDSFVDIASFDVRDLRGGTVALGLLEEARHTRDTVAFYSSTGERPSFLTVGVQLRTPRYIWWSAVIAAVVTATATLGIVAVDKPDLIEKLTLLTLPATVAGAVVLLREESQLARRLIIRTRILLGFVLLLLWLAVLGRLMREGLLPYVDGLEEAIRRSAERSIEAQGEVWGRLLDAVR